LVELPPVRFENESFSFHDRHKLGVYHSYMAAELVVCWLSVAHLVRLLVVVTCSLKFYQIWGLVVEVSVECGMCLCVGC
jgi:hypothetical protein